MFKAMNRGASNMEGILILIGLIFIVLITPRGSSNLDGNSTTTPGTTISSAGRITASNPSTISSGSTMTSSNYNRNISLGSGNAPYEYQPYAEYVTIDNYGQDAVDLTGWQLKNGKDKRPYYSGGNLQRFSADVAVLPTLVLNGGERAIITTGRVSVQSPYPISNFKENICTGYLEALDDYAFSPPLSRNCPRPSEEPGIENLDVECRDFVRSLSSCRTPTFNSRDRDGYLCSTCVNGTTLPSHCAAFIKEHFSYKGCLAYHSSDPNFSGRTWRIFLGRPWEMWAKSYETIELYDRLGQLIDYENY